MWPGPEPPTKVSTSWSTPWGSRSCCSVTRSRSRRLGPELAARGVPYLVMAHGFDFWLSAMPGAHAGSGAHREPRPGARCAARSSAGPCGRPCGRTCPFSVLTPGVDMERFRPDLPTADIRGRLGIGDRPLVVCVSRLVARKGQDVLIRGMRRIRRHVPDAALLIVGGGPAESRLGGLARRRPRGSVFFAGQVPPRRSRLGTTRSGTCSRCRAANRSVGPRGRGLGHRVPGGGGMRTTGRRRGLGRRARDARGRGDRLPRRRRRRRRGGRWWSRGCSGTRPSPAGWARPVDRGSRGSIRGRSAEHDRGRWLREAVDAA